MLTASKRDASPRPPHRLLVFAALTMTACSSPSELRSEPSASAPSDTRRASTDVHRVAARQAELVLAAAPATWPDVAEPALELGAPLARALETALGTEPPSTQSGDLPPGLQLALGLLGAVEASPSAPFLARWIQDDRPLADEAALALGQLARRGASFDRAATIRTLENAMRDPSRPVRLRVAAATAMLDLGESEAAIPVLYTTLVAGTPYGIEPSRENGFPTDQSRWALERRMVIEAIRRHTGGEDFGLDPESPWPDLLRAADRMRAALESEPR